MARTKGLPEEMMGQKTPGPAKPVVTYPTRKTRSPHDWNFPGAPPPGGNTDYKGKRGRGE